MSRLDFRFYSGKYFLRDWTLIKCSGEDRRRFLDGQTTADLKKWHNEQAILTARLDRTGRVQSYFYVITLEQVDYILSPSCLSEKIISDLDKFVIMDDVSFEITSQEVWLVFGIPNAQRSSGVKIQIFGDEAFAFSQGQVDLNLNTIAEDEIKLLSLVNGWPDWMGDGLENKLLNETRLNELAVDYKKGCFLGQETVAKIQNNRGAAFYPSLIELSSPIEIDFHGEIFSGEEKIGLASGVFEYNSEKYLRVMLHRKYRVEGFEITFQIGEALKAGTVKSYPLIKASSLEAKSIELYERGSLAFQMGSEDQSIEFLSLAIQANPKLADAYESLGVIYGRQAKYEAAIDLMNKLEEIDSSSVMAHTNKSLYLMKLGKIELAEEEKAKATLKSFEMYGREADVKKQKLEQEKQKENERRQRESMFYQVLEIDEKDEIANFGLADIFFSENKIEQAIERLNNLLDHHPRYTQAYLLMGKCLESKNNKTEAIETYKKGIEVATARGELMPANEMQSRLRALA